MLVDSHCHLDFPEFASDLDAVVARAGEAGVGTMLTIGTRLDRFAGVRAVAERFANVYCTVGIHPHEAKDWAKDAPEKVADELARLADHPKVVGFGETGLDFYYEHSPKADQERSFRAHIAAARDAGLPLVVHSRDADQDTLRVLRDEYRQGPFAGLMHCFSSGWELAEGALALGLYISFSGIVTFKKADEVRAVAAKVPLDRLLVETDAPYLAPHPNRGKRNEPAFTALTAARLAEDRGLAAEAFAEATTANFFRLFAKAKKLEEKR
ncbi:MAG: TatD family deoxyribonuclease [Acidimicrobiia bacterium]|nr:TatD family deoxyribonuclease [Acidimicrobiia bacterium]